MVNALCINPDDTVVTVLTDLAAGARLSWEGMDGREVLSASAIPFGHKVAISHIGAGDHVVKYGASIGVATRDIEPGEHVHSHNLVTVRGAARP